MGEVAVAALDIVAARALTEKISKAYGNLASLVVEAVNGRIWDAFGRKDFAEYCQEELGSNLAKYTVDQRYEIADALRFHGLSQRKIAGVLGVSQTTVAKDEHKGENKDSPGKVPSPRKPGPKPRDPIRHLADLIESPTPDMPLDKIIGELERLLEQAREKVPHSPQSR
jgi:transcriptional regulator with XRE-family HTH domain